MKRRGFTLLEVLLTLALVVVVLGLLGMAVDVHLRVADAGRNEVEQSQLARRLLRRMADDLRNAVPLAQAPSSIGCLRGNRRELQVDICRLPSLEETPPPASFRDDMLPPSPPSDLRTVTYCVAEPGDLESTEATVFSPRRRGLLRSEWERAALLWAVQQGQTEAFRRSLKVLAPEVEAIEFTYIDGGTVYQEWDSMEQGKLPAAVKIAVLFRQPWRKTQSPSVRGAIEESPLAMHDILVDLPNARATLDQAIAAVAESSTTASKQDQSSDSTTQQTNSQDTGIKEIKPIGANSGGSAQ